MFFFWLRMYIKNPNMLLNLNKAHVAGAERSQTFVYEWNRAFLRLSVGFGIVAGRI